MPLRLLGGLDQGERPRTAPQRFGSVKALLRRLPNVKLGDVVRRRFLSAQLAARPPRAAPRGLMPMPAAVVRRLAAVPELSVSTRIRQGRRPAQQCRRKPTTPR